MDLLEHDQPPGIGPVDRIARGEPVLKPGKGSQSPGPINVPIVFEKHNVRAVVYRPTGVARFTRCSGAGSAICAIMTCFLKFASMDSSSRTSVGRLTSVVSCSI